MTPSDEATERILEGEDAEVHDAPPGWRICRVCGEGQKVEEFYDSHDQAGHVVRNNTCRSCANTAPRKRTTARTLNKRARDLALKWLLDENQDRFAELMTMALREVRKEHAHLVEASGGDEDVILKPGPKRRGEGILDRIDVARCTACHTHHDRGHVCPRCGNSTEEEVRL